MPGKWCDNGKSLATVHLRNTKAYAEGRAHAKAGGLVGDNPHPANSEANDRWATGFNSWADDPANAAPEGRDCVQEAYGGGYTPP